MGGYNKITGHEEPQKLHASTTSQIECVRLSGGKDRGCISLYCKMMSMYPSVFQIHTPGCSVHL